MKIQFFGAGNGLLSLSHRIPKKSRRLRLFGHKKSSWRPKSRKPRPGEAAETGNPAGIRWRKMMKTYEKS